MSADSPLVVLMMVLLWSFKASAKSGSEAEDSLSKTLTDSYNKNLLPAEKITVNITQFHIDRFLVQESSHAVMLNAWIGMAWVDSKLKWTPSLHEGITEIPLHYWDIWIPDMFTHDSMSYYSKHMWSFENVVVNNEGTVRYVPQYELPFYCIMDMTYWPHDTHNCTFSFRSWVHGAHRLDFNLQAKPSVDIGRRVISSGEAIGINEWVIDHISLSKRTNTFKCCKGPFTEVTFTFLLTRNAPAYAWTTKMPAVGLTILGMLMFVLPPAASQKMVYGVLVLLCDLTFLDKTSYIVTSSADHSPLMIQLISQQLFLVVLSLAVSAVIYRICSSPHATGIPAIIRDPVIRISSILLLGNYVDMASGSYKNFSTPMQDDQVELADDSPAALRQKVNNEWLLLGALMERLVLILYLVICTISLIRFSSIL